MQQLRIFDFELHPEHNILFQVMIYGVLLQLTKYTVEKKMSWQIVKWQVSVLGILLIEKKISVIDSHNS